MVTRYDIERVDYEDYDMVAYEHGEYVKFDDYQDLAALYNHLQDKYNRLVKKLGDVYGDA